jgi:predicted  nucleic acid-binding Zn-ribbon protein
MPSPLMKCKKCGEQFRLEPNKPLYANLCPTCSISQPKSLTKEERQKADLDRITELGKEKNQPAVIEAITDFVMKYGKRDG